MPTRHGRRVAEALEAGGFAVVCIEEALELRYAGITGRSCCSKGFREAELA